MSGTLKERVIYKRIIFVFFFAMFFSFYSNKSLAQDNLQPFDYSRTVWIIHNIDGKGIVYGLPTYAEPVSNFITIHKTLMKYVNNLEAFPDSTSVKDLIPEHRLVLMNDVAEQQLLLGSSWISDGQKIALMDETDFNKIKAMLIRREKMNEAFTKHPINPLLQSLRKGIQDNPEEFEYRLQLYKDAIAQEFLDARKTSSSLSSLSSSQASLTVSDFPISSHSSNELSSSASRSNLTASSKWAVQSSSNKEITNTSAEEDESFNFIAGVATIILALLGGFWLIQRSKK
jgi:hypothetical protein